MERSEPTLVPEWLRNPRSLNGGGSIPHSDDKKASKLVRNKSFVSSNGNDFGRSLSSDRTTSSYFRRSSSNNNSCGNLRSHTSFGRKQHDRDWGKDTYDSRDKDKSVLRHSQSIVSGKHEDTWHRKVTTNSSNGSRNNTDGLLNKGSSNGEVTKTTFKRDFPSLGAEDRGAVIHGLSSPIQSLPNGTSNIINGGEKWTSALADIPVSVGSHNGNGPNGISSVQEAAPLSLNMAEAVAQGPSRVQTTPQLSMGTQRLEELAIKQSKQLIPVTPSMPKTMVLNSSDKQKIKVSQHNHPISSSLAVNHSPRSGPGKADFSKAASSTGGKLHVLKPVREKNGANPIMKDNNSSSSGSKLISSTTPAVSTRGPPNNIVPDHNKPVLTVLEKRPTCQAQSRNDFFNTVRKKSIMGNSSSAADPSIANSSSSSSSSEKLAELAAEPTAPNSTPRAGGDELLGLGLGGDRLSETRGDLVISSKNVRNGEKQHPSSSTDPVFSEEEEATFLRSLGWEENADEGGLTEEEISAFFRDVAKYISSKPCLKILMPFGSHIGNIRGISSGPSSSDAKMES